MKLKFIGFIIALIALIAVNAFAGAESAAALYDRGNALYAQGLYDDAIGLYLKAFDAGARDSRLEYNLGNAYLKKNPPDLGRAILHYERARLLDPRDPDLLYNLEFAHSLIKGKLPMAERTYLQEMWGKALARITTNEAAAFFSLFFFMLIISGAIRLLVRSERIRRFSSWAIIIAAIFLLLDLPVLVGKMNRFSENQAVVIEQNVSARSGPGETNPELFQIPVGTVISRKECRGDWCQGLIEGGLAGWIPEKDIELIVPDHWRNPHLRP